MTTPTPTADDTGRPDGIDRRDALRKLAVGGAVVWSAPLIAKTAGATSASSCTTNVVDWELYNVGDTFTSTTVGGITMSINSPDFFGGSGLLAGGGRDRKVQPAPFGSINRNSLMFEQLPRTGGGQNIVFTFSQTVYNINFVITDIDNFSQNGAGWSDRITINSPATYTYATTSTQWTGTSNIIGNGTSSGTTTTTGPFRNSNGNNNYQDNSPAGNIEITMPGPLTSFSFTFSCANIQHGGNQRVNFSNISFCG